MVKNYKDRNIITLIKSNNKAGYKQLIDSYGSAIYGVIFRMVNNEQLANELLKKSIFKLCADIKNNNLGILCLFTYLMQIARDFASKYQNKPATLKPIHLNTILDLIFNKGFSLIAVAKFMNLSIAEVCRGLRNELKQIKNK